MPLEIERKFLVSGDAWKLLSTDSGCRIRQGYICRDPQRTVRIRLSEESDFVTSFVTIKTAGTGICRDEYEYEIPLEHARELLERVCFHPLIVKRRYTLPWQGVRIVVDEFGGENQGLVIAELELPHLHTQVEFPEWFGKEVSEDLQYRNSELAFHPFSTWRQNS